MKTHLYHIVLIVFMACSYTQASAQQNSITDSLLQVLETSREDTQRVRVLNSLSEKYRKINLDRATHYAREARMLSEQVSYEKGIIESMKNTVLTFTLQGKYAEAEALAEEALQLAERSKKGKDIARILNVICYVHGLQGQYEKAMNYCMKALKQSRHIQDDRLSVSILQSIGVIYRNTGVYDKAIACYMDALKLYEHLEDAEGISDILNNVAIIYSIQGRNDKALDYYLRALEAGQSVIGNQGLAGLYSNIGSIYNDKGNHNKALYYHSQALELHEEVGEKKGIAIVLNNIGKAYKDQNKIKKAQEHFLRAVAIYESIGSKSGLANSLNNVSNTYRHQGQYEKALHYAQKALVIAEETGRKQVIKNIYLNLSRISMELDNCPKTLVYYEKYISIKDSLFNAESDKRIAEMQVRYETAEKEKQIALLEKDKVIREAALNKRTVQRNALSAGLLLVAFLAVIWIRSYRYRLKTQKELAAHAEETNRQETLKLIKEEQLRSAKAYIEGQESERMRIASELHDGIVSSLAAVKLNLGSEAPEKGTAQAEAIEDLRKIGEETRVLSHRLSPLPVFSSTFTEALQYFITNLKKSSKLQIYFDAFPAAELNQLDEFIQSNIYRITQELLNNVVKHAQASEVTVQLIQHEESINLVVVDNGKGFAPEKSKTGIGMGTIRSRLSLIEGKMNIDSYLQRGSSIDIQIPTEGKREKVPA